jgi:integrase
MIGPMRAQGTGSIYLRKADGKWVAQLSIGPRGQRRYVRRTLVTKKAAGVALDELRAEGRTNREPLATGRYLESWVTEARDIRATTRAGYASVIKSHLGPAIGAIRLADLTPADVETMLASRAKLMSPKSLRNLHAILRRALQQAVRTGRVERNVAGREYVDTPKVPIVEARALSQAEVARLLPVLPGDRIEGLVITALGTGLRLGELLGLAWEDVDTDRRVLTVRQELVSLGNGNYERQDPKTERSKRRVPLSGAVADAVERQRERQKAEGFAPIATGPVFTNHRGQNLSGSWVTHHFYELLERAEVERIPFKNLRTTFATRLFEAGVSDRMIADLMGHTRVAVTQKHYIASAGASQEPAVAAVDRMLGRAG